MGGRIHSDSALVEGLTTGEIKRDPKIPEEIKDLILPYIGWLHTIEATIPGHIELAYRRGIQAGEERTASETQ